MAKSRLSCLAFAACYAGLLVACDTGGGGAAQEEDAGERQPSLDGLLDRSFTGEPIPDVTLTDVEGRTLALAEIERPVLLNLWTGWCVDCTAELPLLDAMAGELGDEIGILTVSVDLRGAEVAEATLSEGGFENLPSWMDEANDLAMAYGGGATLPLSILYDENGNEVWRVIGAYDWSAADARAAVREGLEPVTPAPRTEPSGDVGPINRE